MYPLEGATGGGDKLTLKGSNLAEVRRISGVEVECKVDGAWRPASFVGDAWWSVPPRRIRRGGCTWNSR